MFTDYSSISEFKKELGLSSLSLIKDQDQSWFSCFLKDSRILIAVHEDSIKGLLAGKSFFTKKEPKVGSKGPYTMMCLILRQLKPGQEEVSL